MIFVWTVQDVIGLGALALIALVFLAAWLHGKITAAWRRFRGRA